MQLNLRVRENLRRRLADEARRARTTVNSTIVQAIEQSFADRGTQRIRLRRGLYDELLEAVRQNGRTLDAEIIERLEQSSAELVSFRPGDRLRADLTSAAQEKSRPLGQEITERLTHSFGVEIDLFHEPAPHYLRRAAEQLMTTLFNLERITGRRVFGPQGDPWLHRQAWQAFATWFAATRPPGTAVPPAPDQRIGEEPQWLGADEMAMQLSLDELRNLPEAWRSAAAAPAADRGSPGKPPARRRPRRRRTAQGGGD